MTETSGGAEPRSLPARLGVAALNIVTPGLGLIRVGRLRAGLLFAFGPVAAGILLVLVMAVAPPLTPTAFLAAVICAFGLAALVYLGSLLVTWQYSRQITRPVHWWRRWYSLLAVFAAVQLSTMVAVPLGHSLYKPFYLPAQAMSPTLIKGDRILADMNVSSDPKRGDIILFDVGDSIYIKRVAALAGDRIAMRDGVPVLNGTPVPQRRIGRFTTAGAEGVVMLEKLPGESGNHRVLDLGTSPQDDMAEVVVPDGHVFVLGDHRDMSADSRIPRERFGVEMLPVEDIRGRPLFRTWDKHYRWLGSEIH